MPTPAPPREVTGPLLPRPTLAAIAVLTLVTTLLGVLPWPRPEWYPGSWASAVAPAPLWILLVGAAAACLVAAVVLLLRTTGLRTGEPVALALIALFVVSAGALVWNALYSAQLSTIHYGALIPVLHWLFTFAPAALAGLLTAGRDRRTRVVAALSSGAVTVPLLGLGWSLVQEPGPAADAVLASLWLTVVLGLVPLAGAVALAGAAGSGPPPYARPGRFDATR